jgi:outer membrane protein OmpA-like peptidoglycan-associated protein
MLAGPPALADQGIDAQLFMPSLDGFGLFSLERTRTARQWDFGLRLGVHYAEAPLKLKVEHIDAPTDRDTVLDQQIAVNLGLSLGLTDNLTFAFEVPLQKQPLGKGYGEPGKYQQVEADRQNVGTGFFSVRPSQNPNPSENTPGDVRLALKYRLLTGKVGMAILGVVYVPFGDEDVFAGSASFTAEPKLIVDRNLGDKGYVAFNAGARLREGVLARTRAVDGTTHIVENMNGLPIYRPLLFVGSEAVVAMGGRFALNSRVSVGGEITMLVPLPIDENEDCTGDCKNGDMTGDAIGGVFFELTPDATLGLGGGLGLIPGAARHDSFRVVSTLSWMPTPEGTRTGGRGDADGDNIPDGPDVCPDEPEDQDSFQDDDGCPELDNDLDGVLDAQDQCVNEPEDRDGFTDDDGCPEGDNDQDQVTDLTDRCPLEPEDKDGYQDDDGCPDEDNDGDGILDGKDKCANEAETVNGVDDFDGCPDQGVIGGPKLVADRIDLQGERIDFVGKTTKIVAASQITLDLVADVMKANPRLRIRLEVGVERSGDKKKDIDADRRLTQDRAREIMGYLLGKGVKEAQLDTAPLGSDRPLDAKNPKDPKINRRVEFIRVTQ